MSDVIEYEEVTKLGTAYAQGLMNVWEKLGRPEDVSVPTGWIMIDQIVAVWQKAFPQEVADWLHDKQIDLSTEKSLDQLLKGQGYNPLAYPPTFFQMMKAMLPDLKLSNKKFQRELIQRHPIFKTTNLKV